MFICRVCKLYVKKDSMPPSCVLNDLPLDPVPVCLTRLNTFEKITHSKSGTLPDMLQARHKAWQSTAFKASEVPRTKILHLPLPIDGNPRLMHDLCADNTNVIVNCVPTSAKIVWKHLVKPKVVVPALQLLSEEARRKIHELLAHLYQLYQLCECHGDKRILIEL